MELNRGVIIIKPKEPLIAWLNTLEKPGDKTILAEAREDSSAYLLPCWESDTELEEALRSVFLYIFEAELHGWIIVESLWPKLRDYDTFRRWFDVEAHSLAFDLGDGCIEAEDTDA